MRVYSKFVNLRNLTLVNCGISEIRGLETLNQLTELVLNENEIERISGIEKCVKLSKLTLSYNKIQKIEGLNGCSSLETLWLAGNQITVEHLIQKIENLSECRRLTRLWLSQNSIECIGNSLDSLLLLEEINFAGNKFSKLEDALNLMRLPSLKSLSFFDPHFGDNPICGLCNYQTFLLSYLKNISFLDTLKLNFEAKAYAESTFLKKKMYYTMRIKSLQRTFHSTLEFLKKQKLQRELQLEKLYSMNLFLSSIQQETAEAKANFQKAEHSRIKKIWSILRNNIFSFVETKEKLLLCESDSGGNFRLEEGVGVEKWFVSCLDLVKSRLFEQDLKTITGLSSPEITRVLRIHNRNLRHAFEETADKHTDLANPEHKKFLEYLFFSVSELGENDYRPVEEYFDMPGLLSVENLKLTNSIALAEIPRILKWRRRNHKTQLKDVVSPGKILICKVLLTNAACEKSQSSFDISQIMEELETEIDVSSYEVEF